MPDEDIDQEKQEEQHREGRGGQSFYLVGAELFSQPVLSVQFPAILRSHGLATNISIWDEILRYATLRYATLRSE
jgi:hypothetical protein